MTRFDLRRSLGPLALCAAILVGGGCDGDDQGEGDGEQRDAAPAPAPSAPATAAPAPAPPPAAAAPAPLAAPADPRAVNVRLREFTIEMQPATISAGPVTFHVTNAGGQPHALEVELESGGRKVEHETQTLQPGPNATTTLTATLQPGTYEVYCPVELNGQEHRDLGMRTTLVVTP